MGYKVLLQQKKSKLTPPYDLEPYTVVNIQGHQVQATRDEHNKTRYANMWKKVKVVPKTDYDKIRERTKTLQRKYNEYTIFDLDLEDKGTSRKETQDENRIQETHGVEESNEVPARETSMQQPTRTSERTSRRPDYYQS